MKKILANITRLTITYSKFLLMIMVLSSSGTIAKADDSYTYLKCGVKYLQLSGLRIKTNYNIRTKKFLDVYLIKKYGEKTIVLMQVGAFFEVYGYKESKKGEMKGSKIEEFGRIIEYKIVPKKQCVGKKNIFLIVLYRSLEEPD